MISKAAWISGLLLGQEADPLGERDVRRKPLGIGGQVGKLAELELAPGIFEEPLRVVAAGRVQTLAHLGDVVGMGGVVIDGRAFAALDLPPARDHVEEIHRVVALPDNAPAALR